MGAPLYSSSPRRRGPSDFALKDPKPLDPRFRGDDDRPFLDLSYFAATTRTISRHLLE